MKSCFFSKMMLRIMILLGVVSCQRENDTQGPSQTSSGALLVKMYDSANASVRDTFCYSPDKKLVKFISAGVGVYADTFMYSNNILVHSQYNGGDTIRPGNPYAKTDYTYANGLLTSSKYYLGTTLVTTSAYVFDLSGRLTQVTQTMINYTPGVTPLYTTRFEYDANSNLTKIYYKEGTNPEYLEKEFLDYDNKVNPFYSLPWRYDVNLHDESFIHLSKNNVGRIKYYNASGLLDTYVYRYEYNAEGKIIKRDIRWSNGLISLGTKYFIYRP